MGRCPFTPCVETSAGSAEGDGAWESAQEAYAAEVQRVRDFLHGRDTSVVTVIEQRMREAASRLEFEQASYYRDALKRLEDRKSTRLNSSHVAISYAVFCLKK